MVKIYITLAALTFATFFSGAANAMIQEKGVFVPSHCGAAEVEMPFDVNVKSVCLGRISGENDPIKGSAAVITMTDGSETLFHVTGTSSELMALESGITQTMFFLKSPAGSTAKLKTSKSKDGEIRSAVVTLGVNTYFVPAFENVLVMM